MPLAVPELERTEHSDPDRDADQHAPPSRAENERQECRDDVDADVDPPHVRQAPITPRRKHVRSRYSGARRATIAYRFRLAALLSRSVAGVLLGATGSTPARERRTLECASMEQSGAYRLY